MTAKKVVQRPYFNVDTGEALTLQHEEEVTPRRRPVDFRSKEPFSFAFAGGFAELARMGLTGQEWDIVAYMISAAPMSTEPGRYRTADIAEFLDAPPQSISRAMGRLRSKGIVLDGEGGTRYLSPEYHWRGKVRDRMDALHKLGLVIEKE